MEEWTTRFVPQHTPRQVLVAIGDMALRERVFSLLQERGEEVAIANDFRDIIPLCQTLRFDYALADLRLYSGLEGLPTLLLLDEAIAPDDPVPCTLRLPFEDQDLMSAIDSFTALQPSEAPSEALFSPENALVYLDDDQDLLREMLNYCVADAPLRLLELNSTLERGDLKGMEFLAHNLKGLVGGIAAKMAWQAAYSLELAAKNGNIAEIHVALERVRQEVERLLPTLQNYLGVPQFSAR